MRIGVSLPNVGLDHGKEMLLPVAAAAERLGFDSVWVAHHVLLPYERDSKYPYAHSGTEIAMSPGMQWLDPLVTLAAIAAVTDRVKLGTSVFVVPYRDPVTLAAEIAALDVLSDGRFIFGAGIGWMREEFAAIGIPPDERGARTDEHLEAMKVLWTEDPASFDGKYTKFENVVLATQPRTEGGPPIWIGGNTDAALRRVVRLGEAWHGFEVFVDEIPGIRERIAAHAEEAGRDPEEIELTVARGLIPPGREEESFIPERRMLGGSGEAVVDELGRYAEAGVGMVLIQISLLSPHVPDALEWVASEVLAKVG